jgi:hypothetical protein
MASTTPTVSQNLDVILEAPEAIQEAVEAWEQSSSSIFPVLDALERSLMCFNDDSSKDSLQDLRTVRKMWESVKETLKDFSNNLEETGDFLSRRHFPVKFTPVRAGETSEQGKARFEKEQAEKIEKLKDRMLSQSEEDEQRHIVNFINDVEVEELPHPNSYLEKSHQLIIDNGTTVKVVGKYIDGVPMVGPLSKGDVAFARRLGLPISHECAFE